MSDHKSLHEAVLAFQAEAPTLHKGETARVESKRTGKSYTYKYIGLDTIVEVVGPLLVKHGLTWMTFPGWSENEPALHYTLTHATSGDNVMGSMPLMLTEKDPQAMGSALTYARRYALTAVLNLVADEDDDGAKASQRRHAAPQAQQNGHSEYATKADQDALAAAAKGLTVRQIKLALGSVGSSFPEKGDLFSMVPKGTARRLTELLAATPREQLAPASPGELS